MINSNDIRHSLRLLAQPSVIGNREYAINLGVWFAENGVTPRRIRSGLAEVNLPAEVADLLFQ